MAGDDVEQPLQMQGLRASEKAWENASFYLSFSVGEPPEEMENRGVTAHPLKKTQPAPPSLLRQDGVIGVIRISQQTQ